ncbi:M42 family metallopeptidase [Mechercharimyces sp. CAU 1602]|uniref:M42 family metallopeptidase n=1 Tax=Mechercharimyces sp. CAU 1602 TaxID=2973933 RepID=UPI002162E43B|nr:M42 family metallopeptidase [Mechercharimyces sp. CAU 1602]MCS1350136.1 M42 family metallopeptidase [Mechercharimyces sp. CAU 1602]
MKRSLQEKVITTLQELIETPSPTGMTAGVIAYIKKRLQPYALKMEQTNKGGLLVTIPGEDQEQWRFVTAHVDTLGAMVKEVKTNGRLALSNIGGYSWHSVDGTYCTVHTDRGKAVSGTILASKTSVHAYGEEARTQKRIAENMELRLDAKVKKAEDVEELGIQVGDFVSFSPLFEACETGFIKGRHMDDKASAALLLEWIIQHTEEGKKLPHTTQVFFSTFEEVGFGANSNISARVKEYLAIDMGVIGDGQTTDEFCVSICAKDSSGPYHAELRQHLVRLAQQEDLYYKVDLYPFYGSDASAAVAAGYDIKHALIGPGVDASHAYERTHREALVNTYQLLMAYVQSPILS